MPKYCKIPFNNSNNDCVVRYDQNTLIMESKWHTSIPYMKKESKQNQTLFLPSIELFFFSFIFSSFIAIYLTKKYKENSNWKPLRTVHSLPHNHSILLLFMSVFFSSSVPYSIWLIQTWNWQALHNSNHLITSMMKLPLVSKYLW